MATRVQVDAIAHVRLHFDPDIDTKHQTEHGKAVRGPSGRTYYFDGPQQEGQSPWVPVYPQHRKDLEMFEQNNVFEVRRE